MACVDFLRELFYAQFRACAFFVGFSIWKDKYLAELGCDAPRNGGSPARELPYCSLWAFPVPVALLSSRFGPLNGIGFFFQRMDLIAENDSQVTASAFINGFLQSLHSFFEALSVCGSPRQAAVFLFPFLVLSKSSTVDVLLVNLFSVAPH